MTPRFLIVAVIAALVALAGCTTDQASRNTAPAPSPGMQGGQSMGGGSMGGGGMGGGGMGGGSSGY
ncbi:hypothetical protein LAC81_10100 [Ensifer adhaerens]|uniref:hypothetical protein n=1 Tax=Ensifer adhaerens TaxID=106592 RepID=UPI001CC0DAF1|nr:hypothetical protein [Ensifer adhaerens]MBZ7922138.1 hypothetical protein [Ensifer adhaerens]UAX94520.1 hypothetical protein LAC78_10095 [Ensifer adhaerens]UAY02155.1 hypothetical protein LAC80_10105 [Ensifer adhaerens]UAY09538.1 hypothetical protein LAC81_10100 [Ensifer adhaerens]